MVAAVGVHHGRVIIHNEINADFRLVPLAETSPDEVRHPEEIGCRGRVGAPALDHGYTSWPISFSLRQTSRA